MVNRELITTNFLHQAEEYEFDFCCVALLYCITLSGLFRILHCCTAKQVY